MTFFSKNYLDLILDFLLISDIYINNKKTFKRENFLFIFCLFVGVKHL